MIGVEARNTYILDIKRTDDTSGPPGMGTSPTTQKTSRNGDSQSSDHSDPRSRKIAEIDNTPTDNRLVNDIHKTTPNKYTKIATVLTFNTVFV